MPVRHTSMHHCLAVVVSNCIIYPLLQHQKVTIAFAIKRLQVTSCVVLTFSFEDCIRSSSHLPLTLTNTISCTCQTWKRNHHIVYSKEVAWPWLLGMFPLPWKNTQLWYFFLLLWSTRGGGAWHGLVVIKSLHKLKHYPMKLLTLSTKKTMTKYKVDILTFFQNHFMNIKRHYDHLSFLGAFCTRS